MKQNQKQKILNRRTQKHPIVLEIKQAKILKQIIMRPHPYLATFLKNSCINERHSMTLDVETEKKKSSMTSYYPRNG